MGRKRTPEEEARRELIRELFKETIAEFMEDSLDAELEETLGYGKYDHAARTEAASLNRGYSQRTRPASRQKSRVKLFRCTPKE